MKPLTLLAGVTLLAGTAHAGLVDPALEEVMRPAAPDQAISALVYLVDRVDTSALSAVLDAQRTTRQHRHQVVATELHRTAAATQGALLAHLQAARATGLVTSFKSYWIANVVRVDAVPAELRAIAARPDVDRVYLNHEIELIQPVALDAAGAGGAALGAIEPGVLAVRADEVWAMGFDGTGVLVSHMDTGVDGNHPALASRWAGLGIEYAGHPDWAWYDPHNGDNSFPYDDVFGSHGTHTMGTVCGGMPGDQIGVAPGARWISVGAIDRPGADIPTTVAHAIDGFEWLADPDGNFATVWDVPATNSNSWGVTTAHGYPECDETFWTFVDGLEAAGCAVFFSAGNEGTSGLRRPADRATTHFNCCAVAAVDGNLPSFPIAGFSSRGPTQCTPGGIDAIKPDIAAPGVDVRSSLAGGSYGFKSGTSMASPHVNGVAALILSANPDLSVTQLKNIIYATALDLGTAGEDNDYGHGMIDAVLAVEMALETLALSFNFPNGRPEFVDPNGGTTIRVVVSGQAVAPEPGTGLLYYRAGGGGYTSVAMTQVTPNVYDAVFPAFACGAIVDYYFSAESTEGDVAFNPFSAPATTYHAQAYSGLDVAFSDNFQTDTGWTVLNEALEDGQWDRGVPAGDGDRGDPTDDADGSGACFLTDNVAGNSDVDGGPTRLLSPIIDVTGLDDPVVSYSRWFTNDDDDSDNLLVQISNNGGAAWVTLENVIGDTTGWVTQSFRVADFVTPTATIRLRFSAADQPNDSVTEGGIDAVSFSSFFCKELPCPTDLDVTGDVGFGDLLLVLSAWGPCPGCPEDLDDNGDVGFSDLLTVLSEWGPCP
jgi:bacillopeptidase F